MATPRVFLLSPAHCGGERAQLLFNPRAKFDLACRLRTESVPLGEVFAFLSGLYFRGKLAYAERFGLPLVITTNAGLLPADTRVTLDTLLGSIASDKYVDALLSVFGERLTFPAEFVGRGDMSRGGLLLRCVRAGQELTYVSVAGAVRHGPRPPRLTPVR